MINPHDNSTSVSKISNTNLLEVNNWNKEPPVHFVLKCERADLYQNSIKINSFKSSFNKALCNKNVDTMNNSNDSTGKTVIVIDDDNYTNTQHDRDKEISSNAVETKNTNEETKKDVSIVISDDENDVNNAHILTTTNLNDNDPNDSSKRYKIDRWERIKSLQSNIRNVYGTPSRYKDNTNTGIQISDVKNSETTSPQNTSLKITLPRSESPKTALLESFTLKTSAKTDLCENKNAESSLPESYNNQTGTDVNSNTLKKTNQRSNENNHNRKELNREAQFRSREKKKLYELKNWKEMESLKLINGELQIKDQRFHYVRKNALNQIESISKKYTLCDLMNRDLLNNLRVSLEDFEDAEENPLTNTNNAPSNVDTPTRFIEQCEQVGLFQDLSKINLFDNVFKNALEGRDTNKKSKDTLEDSLNTPDVLMDENCILSKPDVENRINNSSKDTLPKLDQWDRLKILQKNVANVYGKRNSELSNNKENPFRDGISSNEDLPERTDNNKILISYGQNNCNSKYIDSSSSTNNIEIFKSVKRNGKSKFETKISSTLNRKEYNRIVKAKSRARKKKEDLEYQQDIEKLKQKNNELKLKHQRVISEVEMTLRAIKGLAKSHTKCDKCNKNLFKDIIYEIEKITCNLYLLNNIMQVGGQNSQSDQSVLLKHNCKFKRILPKEVYLKSKKDAFSITINIPSCKRKKSISKEPNDPTLHSLKGILIKPHNKPKRLKTCKKGVSFTDKICVVQFPKVTEEEENDENLIIDFKLVQRYFEDMKDHE